MLWCLKMFSVWEKLLVNDFFLCKCYYWLIFLQELIFELWYQNPKHQIAFDYNYTNKHIAFQTQLFWGKRSRIVAFLSLFSWFNALLHLLLPIMKNKCLITNLAVQIKQLKSTSYIFQLNKLLNSHKDSPLLQIGLLEF